MAAFNVFDDTRLEVDTDEPDGYRAPQAKVTAAIGATQLAGSVTVMPQGSALCPYHYELAEEEWLLVLAGRPTVRTPAGEEVLSPGDLVCFPRGPEGAHMVFNAAAEPARVFMVSDAPPLSGTVYPDSDKLGVFTRGRDDGGLFRREDARDYWDREPPRAS